MTVRDAVTSTLACVFKIGQSDSVAGTFFSNDQRVSDMHYACCMYALPGLVGIFCLLLRKCLIKHSLLLPSSPTYLRTGKQMSRFCINHKRADSPTTLTGYGLDFTAYINNDHFVHMQKKLAFQFQCWPGDEKISRRWMLNRKQYAFCWLQLFFF